MTLTGNWNSFNRTELARLLQTLGKSSPSYDPARPPYAVFDWDNTSVFLDVEEATMVYQLQNLAFAATPTQMDDALRSGLPADPEVEALVNDISESYAWLREHGDQAVASLTGNGLVEAHLASFRAKYLRLYQLLEHKYGAPVAYPWIPFRYTAMTAAEVREVARKAVEWQLKQPIEEVTWSSPETLAGQAGLVQVTWRNGLRTLPEMQGLYRSLREAGFDVWVCTASFVEGIREISSAPDFGYGNAPERVIGLELECDPAGRYLPVRKQGSEVTYAEGKTEALRRLLLSRYGYAPALVAGDSNGDAPMLSDFQTTRIGLIIDTGKSPDTPIGQLVAAARQLRGQTGARYLVQERDEKAGLFLP